MHDEKPDEGQQRNGAERSADGHLEATLERTLASVLGIHDPVSLATCTMIGDALTSTKHSVGDGSARVAHDAADAVGYEEPRPRWRLMQRDGSHRERCSDESDNVPDDRDLRELGEHGAVPSRASEEDRHDRAVAVRPTDGDRPESRRTQPKCRS